MQRALETIYGDGLAVRVQMPLALDPDSEPEPDIAVVRGSPRDHRDAHPATAVLIVEVADTSLAHDRERKTRVYARAGIPEYWVVNLVDEVVEVHRDPCRGGYGTATLHRRGQRVGSSVLVDDLLP